MSFSLFPGVVINQIDLRNRHAIVTGAAQGIGLAIARRLLESGASVSMWDRDEQLLSNAVNQLGSHDRAVARCIDITDASSVESGVAFSISTFGKVDIMVANAGIAGPNHTTWQYPIEQWMQVIDVNLIGVFLCCRAVIPHMRRKAMAASSMSLRSPARKEMQMHLPIAPQKPEK